MAAPAWPDYALVVADGVQAGKDSDVSRTPWDDGASRQARARTAALRTWGIEALLDSDADATRFRAWLDEHAHAWFAWTSPEDGVSRQVRVRGGASGAPLTSRTSGGVRRWSARLTLEGFA